VVLGAADAVRAPRAEGVEADLHLTGLVKRFGPVVAVDGISLAIEKGEFITLLGPSGCGKTTTLRLVAGFEQQTAGTVRIQGRSVDGVPPHRRNCNTVFQNYALFPHMSVFENVAFGLRVRHRPAREIEQKVREALERVHLAGYEQRRPHQLSGGQQQRVALARALVNEPAILLLDEPLGALDLKLRKEMQLELKRIHRDVGITFVYVTHDQEEALTMSDRIAVMEAGRVAQFDTPRQIYERPTSTFVASFVGESNFFPGRVLSSDGERAMIALEQGAALPCVDSARLPPGTAVVVQVRPESVLLEAAPRDDAGPGLDGSIEDVVYLGPRAEVMVRLDGSGQLVQCEDYHQRALQRSFGRGQRVRTSWLAERGRLFETDSHDPL
jgi:spermidine/putrescine transport system ATP-binding protein